MSKDLMIMRQSQMRAALKYYQMLGIKPTCLELLAMTDHLVQYCSEGLNKNIIDKTKKVDSFLSELNKDA